MDPLSIISFTTETFSLTLKLLSLFQKALQFTSTSEKLLLQLQVERARLVLWGRNSGLAYGGLRNELVPFETLIVGVLEKVRGLVEDSSRLRQVYGLVDVGVEGEKRSLSFLKIRDSFRGALKRGHGNINIDESLEPSSSSISLPSRIRWAISSQSHFESLVRDIRRYTDSLNDLLRESQQLSFSHDWNRVQFHVLAGVNDPRSLQLVKDISEGDRVCSNMFSMAVRKRIVVADSEEGVGAGISILRKEDFDLPLRPGENRFIACYKHSPPTPTFGSESASLYVLVEKKRYQPNISSEEKELLRNRLHSLIHLLNSSSRDRDNLPLCIGYWSEPENNCWSLVYKFNLKLHFIPQASRPEIYSLLSLIQTPSFRPPLEERLELASTLASVFSRLFGAQWFHKSIRCENILFPPSSSSSLGPSGPRVENTDIRTPLITGFEYSRQYTENTSIDYVGVGIEEALYRHPDYQDDGGADTTPNFSLCASGSGSSTDRDLGSRKGGGGGGGVDEPIRRPSGYRMSYDIYSFGLLLAEIAWWVPLETIYQEMIKSRNVTAQKQKGKQEKPFGGSNKIRTPLQPPTIFQATQARQLREEIIKRAKKQMAFKFGTVYRDVVVWCLERGPGEDGRDGELAEEFYVNVVVKLESLGMKKGREG